MTRTGKSPRLSQHIAEPFVEIHPDDAAIAGVGVAELVQVESPRSRKVARVLITDRTPPGTIFAPMHWTAQTASSGRVDALMQANTDPVSGQPELKRTAVRLSPYRPAWFGFAVSRDEPVEMSGSDYWAKARIPAGWRIELAGCREPDDWIAHARAFTGRPGAEIVDCRDDARRVVRIALIEGGRIVAALFAGQEPVAVSRGFVTSALDDTEVAAPSFLASRPGGHVPDPGAIVCSCFQVGVNAIVATIESRSLTNVEQIGAILRAGTNCGSCRPELSRLLAHATPSIAAE